MIRECDEHGPGYTRHGIYIFEKMISRDSLNKIYSDIYQTQGVPIHIYSRFEIFKDSILVHYFVEDGYFDKLDKLMWQKATQTDVLYIWRSNNWSACDSSIIEKMISI